MLGLAIALGLGALAPGAALAAEDTPAITLNAEAPAEVLYGAASSVTLTAANPAAQPYGYNLSFRAVLPKGVKFEKGSSSFSSGSAGEPKIIENEPAAGETTLIWVGLGDLSPASKGGLAFKVLASTASFTVGQSYRVSGGAYLTIHPRFLPKFSATGQPEGPSAESFTGSALASAETELSAIIINQEENSPEGEILRGVHDHQVLYKLTVSNTSINSTKEAFVDDYLPADLEYLGCGGAKEQDHTLEAPTNLPSAEEYPGSGLIKVAPLGGCPAASLVETLETEPNGAGPESKGVYTHVRWSLGTLAPGETRTIEFRAAVPLRENTTTWVKGIVPSAASGEQAPNLDNNDGKETKDGETINTYARASGSYEGKTPVQSHDKLTRIAKDLTTEKSANTKSLAEGELTLWTILVHSSEYRYNTAITVTDTVPNGLCPIDEANPAKSAECEYRGKAEELPSPAFSKAVENSNGTWTLTWEPGASAELAKLEQNATTTLTYATRTRTHYQSEHAPAGPVLANDSITNTVFAAGTTNVVCGGDSDCAAKGEQPIYHERPLSEPVSDNSSFGQLAAGPSIEKQVAKSGTSCLSDEYTNETPVYHPGDLVCWRVEASFPLELDTVGLMLTDFLPLDALFEPKFNGGKGEARAAHDTLENTTFNSSEAATAKPGGGYLIWTLPESGHVKSGAQVFERVYATTAELTKTTTQGELQGNLLKFANQNTPGESFPLRAEADFALSFPALGLSKNIVKVDGSKVGPSNKATVKGGDKVEFSLAVSNSGPFAASGAEVWDELPTGITCEDIEKGSISGKGLCISGRISWGETHLAEEELTVAPSGKTELTFVVEVPKIVGPSTGYEDHAGVIKYESATNTGGKYLYVPQENLDGLRISEENAPAANASADMTTEAVKLEKAHTSSINEGGAGPNGTAQATIGEEVPFTITATIPVGTTLGGSAHLTDPGLPGAGQLALVGGSVKFTVEGPREGEFKLEEAGGTPTLVFPEDYEAPSSGNVVVKVTFKTHVTNVTGNVQPIEIANTTKLEWKNPTTGETARREEKNKVPVVEPKIGLSEKTITEGKPVSGGQIVEYKLTLTNGEGRSTAYESTLVDSVASGVTPSNKKGEPLKEGGATEDGGVWNEKAATITWTLATLGSHSEHAFTYYAVVDEHPVSGTELKDTALASTKSAPTGEYAEARTAANAPSAGDRAPYEAGAHSELEVAGPTITKESDSPTGTIGHQITYTLHVTLPAHVLAYDTTIIDTLPDSLDLDRYGSATCTSGCPPETAPTVQTYRPVIAPTGTTVAWSLGDLPETGVVRTETITYIASIRTTHRNGAAKISAGAKIANKAELYYDKSNKIGFEEEKIPATGSFDKSNGPVGTETEVIEPAITLAKQASVAGGPYSASPFTITDGQSVAYKLIVKNTGTSPAYDVAVKDKPSLGLVEVSATNKEDVTKEWTAGEPEIQWLIKGPLAAGATIELSYSGKLAPVAELHENEAIDNEADVPAYFGASEAERAAGNENYAKEPILYREYTGPTAKVEGKVVLPEIMLEKTTGTEPFPHSANAEVGQPFKWRVVVKNVSSVAAKNLAVTDMLPPNWTYDASSATFAPGGSSEPVQSGSLATGLTLKWSTPIELAAGQSTVLTYEAKPTTEAATNPGTGEAHPSINSASAAVQDSAGNSGDETGPFASASKTAQAVLLIPGLVVKKTPLHAEVAAGEPDEFTVTIENNGTGTAREVTVLDTLPTGMTYTPGSATAEPSSGFSEVGHTAATVTWKVASLAAGKAVKIKIPVGTEASLQGTHHLTNTVAVHSNEQPTPVEASGEVTTHALAELTATKVVAFPEGGLPATPGAEAVYEVTATNHGPSVAASVTLVDILPGTLTYVEGTAGCAVVESTNTVTCTAGYLAPGEKAAFRITVRLSSSVTSPITNLVTAETPTEDSNKKPTAETTLKVLAAADLSLVKTDLAPRGAILDGKQVTYSLLISNAGPSDAAAPIVTDTLPKGLLYVSATGAACKAAEQVVTCELGPEPLVAGASRTIDLTAAAAEPGQFINVAKVESPTEDPNPENNASQAPLTVDPAADLSIVKTATDETVPVPGSTTYTLLVHNNGPDAAQNVEVVDDLPAGEGYAGAEAGCSAAGQVLTCLLGEMANSSSRELHLKVSLTTSLAGQIVTNIAAVKSTTADPEPANNRSEAPIHTGESADVAIAKRGPATVATGGRITWTLTATNHGPSTATSVIVTDPLPAGTAYSASEASQGTCAYSAPTLTCSIGTLDSGASASATVTAKVTSGAGTILNTASVVAHQPDPEPANNSASATTTVLAQPKLTLRKLVRQRSVVPGGELDYRVILHNAGPGAAQNLKVCDLLPTSTTVLDRGRGHLAGGRICFGLASLAAGASHTFALVLRADSTATSSIVNHATATGSNVQEVHARVATPVAAGGVESFRSSGVTG